MKRFLFALDNFMKGTSAVRLISTSIFVMLMASAFIACKPAAKGTSKVKDQTSSGSKYNLLAGFGSAPDFSGRISLAVYKGVNRIEDTFSLETYVKAATIDVKQINANNELKIGDLLFKGTINVGKDSDGRESTSAQVIDETCQINDLKLIFDIQSEDANQPNSPQFPTINCVAKNSQNRALTAAQICTQNGGTELNGSCSCTGKPGVENPDVNILFPAANSTQAVIAGFEQEVKAKCSGPNVEQICKTYGGTVINGSCSCTGKFESKPDVNVLFPKSDAGSTAIVEYENELKSSCIDVGGSTVPDPAPIPSR